MSEPTFEGGCPCGAVRYRATAPQLRSGMYHFARTVPGLQATRWFAKCAVVVTG